MIKIKHLFFVCRVETSHLFDSNRDTQQKGLEANVAQGMLCLCLVFNHHIPTLLPQITPKKAQRTPLGSAWMIYRGAIPPQMFKVSFPVRTSPSRGVPHTPPCCPGTHSSAQSEFPQRTHCPSTIPAPRDAPGPAGRVGAAGTPGALSTSRAPLLFLP